MKYYFAHPITIYNTKKEHVLIDLIRYCPFFSNPDIVNPNSDYNESRYKKEGMDYFLSLVDTCDCLVFYPFEDGSIGAGVVKEIERAKEKNKRVFGINPDTFEMFEVRNELKNCLTVEETRKKIKKINERKEKEKS